MRFKVDWASLIVGSKLTVFALFYFVFEGNFPSTNLVPRAFPLKNGKALVTRLSKYKPPGAYIWRGDLPESFFALPVWGAYIWGLYMEGLIFGILR